MLWRALFNGWPTSARMRSMPGQFEGTCVLGCTSARDRIEHYAVCPVVWGFLSAAAPAGKGINRRFRCLEGFLAIEACMVDLEKKANGGGCLCYCSHRFVTFTEPTLSSTAAAEALRATWNLAVTNSECRSNAWYRGWFPLLFSSS